jgi:histidinol-phosphate phosphatase family protein
MNAVFLDRDGTVTVGTPTYDRVDKLEKVQLLPHSITALKELAKMDYAVFFVTNQAGIAEGRLSWDDFQNINNKVLEFIAETGIKIIKTLVCPHGEHDDCECRKPKPKLLVDASKEYDIDLHASWMIGDRPSDVQTGVNAGTKTILVKTGDPDVESDVATYTANNLLDAVLYIKDSLKTGET